MIRGLLGWPTDTLRFLCEKPARLAVILSAFVIGGIAGMPYGEGLYRYTWTDSRFCDDCHAHDYANEAWAKSVHANLTTCHDCHRVPISHYPVNLWLAAFDRPQSQSDIHRPKIAAVVCEQCHSDAGADEVLTGPMSQTLRKEVVHIDRSPLHQLHMDAETRDPGSYRGAGGGFEEDAEGDDSAGAQAITCLDCHGSATDQAHQFVARPEVCEECHENQVLSGVRTVALSCRDCHFSGFLGTTSASVAAP